MATIWVCVVEGTDVYAFSSREKAAAFAWDFDPYHWDFYDHIDGPDDILKCWDHDIWSECYFHEVVVDEGSTG